MATDVFHMDANGVRISVDRAVFANHTYATRNISSVAAIADKGVRWPGIFTMVLGIGLLIGGFVFSHTFTLILGVGGVLSGSLNLSRKRPKYGLRIITQRGPVYVLASQDKQYVETVSTALQRAMSAARKVPAKAGAAVTADVPPSDYPETPSAATSTPSSGTSSPSSATSSLIPTPPPVTPTPPPVTPTPPPVTPTPPPVTPTPPPVTPGPPAVIPAQAGTSPPFHPRRPQRFRKRRRR